MLPIAFLPCGNNPMGIPMLLILGWYFLKNRIARTICLTLFVAWTLLSVINAIMQKNASLLIFPGLGIIAWIVISEVDKSFK